MRKTHRTNWSALYLAILLSACASDVPERRNLLVVSLDTTRLDHLSTYGYPRQTSPNIDRLAADGVLFEQAFSQSPKTAPSHMTVFTGLYPESHGVRNYVDEENENWRLSSDVTTLAQVLASYGYRTHAITSGGNVRKELGFGCGWLSQGRRSCSRG